MSDSTASGPLPHTREPGLAIELDLGYDAATVATKEALKAEGFGILTEIDLRAAFQEKLGREFRPYVILGACNPPLAYKAVTAAPEVGLLLPCNVTVEENPAGGSIVRLIDPQAMLSAGTLADHPELREVAVDAGIRLERVATRLRGDAPAGQSAG